MLVAPVAGLNHSTRRLRVLDMADRFTVNAPPAGAYTRYSAPTGGVCARQKEVEHNPARGETFPMFSRRAYSAIAPRLSRKLSQRLSGLEQIPFCGEPQRLRFSRG